MNCSFLEFISISIDLHLFLEKPRKFYVIALILVSVWLCLMMVDEMMDVGVDQDGSHPTVSIGYAV